jgi:periplasmic protein TonB
MYASPQQSSPATRVVGVSAAVLITALMGYALATGMAQDVVRKIETVTTMTILTPEVEVPEPVVEEKPKIEVETPPIEKLIVPEPKFMPDELPPILAEVTPVLPPVESAPIGPASGSNISSPKLRNANPPPYPPASIRAQEQGITHLQICVSAQGRVTDASVIKSSGYSRLDDAAAKWVRSARFTPGTVGGVAQNMCGHEILYQWDLKDAGR